MRRGFLFAALSQPISERPAGFVDRHQGAHENHQGEVDETAADPATPNPIVCMPASSLPVCYPTGGTERDGESLQVTSGSEFA